MTDHTDSPVNTALPTVVIIGRPNVGKSTLFNRIVGSQQAIVEDRPGITRDRKELEAEWLDIPFLVVDTGGWMPGGDALEEKVSRQVEQAVQESDVVLFVVDASVGLTDDDQTIANWIRRTKTEVVVVANKSDNERREAEMWGFMSLGLGEPVPVSALHGRRAGDLLDVVLSRFPEEMRQPPVHPDDEWLPRTTDEPRDEAAPAPCRHRRSPERRQEHACSTAWWARTVRSCTTWPAPPATRSTRSSRPTTGPSCSSTPPACAARRRSTTRPSTTRSSVHCERSTTRTSRCSIIDATVGVTAQDQRLAERVDAAGCPTILVLNKWELVGTEERLEVLGELRRKLGFVGDAPVLKISALSGKNVDKLHPLLQEAISQYHTRVPTRDVNRIIATAQQSNPAPGGAKILYATQGAIDPPTFTLFVNRELGRPYLRYIERTIREEFGLGSTAMKIRVRKRE